ncbi:MAG: hypothetical protein JW910_22670 [Anaerolineae bacterium]|nr:hypothetical protein [Anaerolineae bacterium]
MVNEVVCDVRGEALPRPDDAAHRPYTHTAANVRRRDNGASIRQQVTGVKRMLAGFIKKLRADR